MKKPFVFAQADVVEAEQAASRVRAQRRTVLALAGDDPALPCACAVLRHMEQNAVVAALNRAISVP